MTKIYVGNLPFSASESEIRELFAQHGTVESVSIINDRDTGRPRGFGFVEMSRADASRARRGGGPQCRRMMPPIGQPLDRVDGRAKVTGGARYAAENNLADLTYAVLVTSTIPAGTFFSFLIAPPLGSSLEPVGEPNNAVAPRGMM